MTTALTILKAAADETRLRILRLLSRSELAVSDLTRILRQSQPRVSRHLKMLADAGLVERHKEGAWVFYRLTGAAPVDGFARALLEFAGHDDAEYRRDDARLDEVRAERIAAADRYFAQNAADWDRIRALYVPEADVEAAVVRLLAQRPIATLLDVGTGTGRMLEVLSAYARTAVGIDISREMLSVARGRLEARGLKHCQVRHGDMYDLPKDAGPFDAILFHQVLHFAEEPRLALQEAASALRDSGRLLVVDFAPHEKEFLREQHAHRRLGFADSYMAEQMAAAGLRATSVDKLPGSDLTVTLWMGEKVA
jgi:ArsR family transcriptional regulator